MIRNIKTNLIQLKLIIFICFNSNCIIIGILEFYDELEEETEDFVGVEHVRVTKRYLRDWENPMEFCNEEEFLL